MADRKRRRRSRRKNGRKSTGNYRKILIIAGIVIAVLAVAYLGAGAYFQGRFTPGTKVNGLNVGGKTVAQAEEMIQDKLDSYVLTVTDRNGETGEVAGKDISLKYVSDGTLESIRKKQNAFAWLASFLVGDEQSAEYQVEYDESALKEIASGFAFLDPEEEVDPVNAYPAYSDSDGQFTVVEEEYGTLVDEDKFYSVLADKLDTLQDTLDMDTEKCYVAPEYTTESPEVTEACDTLNSWLGAQITYVMHNDEKVTVSKDELAKMLTVSSKMKAKVKKKSVKSYIQSLKDTYDTTGETVEFKTHAGKTIEISGVGFGWSIDLDAETKQLTKDIKNVASTEREPEYSQTGDVGDTYAELDISNQTMYFVKDGETVLETEVVTGNVSAGNGTPTGLYSIAYKQRDRTLRGPKQSDGSYEWESFVSYWMPFNGGIGFHDASWRSTFGGSIYKTNGSHGCVNMPTSKAKELYSYVEAGTPVVVY